MIAKKSRTSRDLHEQVINKKEEREMNLKVTPTEPTEPFSQKEKSKK